MLKSINSQSKRLQNQLLQKQVKPINKPNMVDEEVQADRQHIRSKQQGPIQTFSQKEHAMVDKKIAILKEKQKEQVEQQKQLQLLLAEFDQNEAIRKQQLAQRVQSEIQKLNIDLGGQLEQQRQQMSKVYEQQLLQEHQLKIDQQKNDLAMQKQRELEQQQKYIELQKQKEQQRKQQIIEMERKLESEKSQKLLIEQKKEKERQQHLQAEKLKIEAQHKLKEEQIKLELENSRVELENSIVKSQTVIQEKIIEKDPEKVEKVIEKPKQNKIVEETQHESDELVIQSMNTSKNDSTTDQRINQIDLFQKQIQQLQKSSLNPRHEQKNYQLTLNDNDESSECVEFLIGEEEAEENGEELEEIQLNFQNNDINEEEEEQKPVIIENLEKENVIEDIFDNVVLPPKMKTSTVSDVSTIDEGSSYNSKRTTHSEAQVEKSSDNEQKERKENNDMKYAMQKFNPSMESNVNMQINESEVHDTLFDDINTEIKQLPDNKQINNDKEYQNQISNTQSNNDKQQLNSTINSLVNSLSINELKLQNVIDLDQDENLVQFIYYQTVDLQTAKQSVAEFMNQKCKQINDIQAQQLIRAEVQLISLIDSQNEFIEIVDNIKQNHIRAGIKQEIIQQTCSKSNEKICSYSMNQTDTDDFTNQIKINKNEVQTIVQKINSTANLKQKIEQNLDPVNYLENKIQTDNIKLLQQKISDQVTALSKNEYKLQKIIDLDTDETTIQCIYYKTVEFQTAKSAIIDLMNKKVSEIKDINAQQLIQAEIQLVSVCDSQEEFEKIVEQIKQNHYVSGVQINDIQLNKMQSKESSELMRAYSLKQTDLDISDLTDQIIINKAKVQNIVQKVNNVNELKYKLANSDPINVLENSSKKDSKEYLNEQISVLLSELSSNEYKLQHIVDLDSEETAVQCIYYQTIDYQTAKQAIINFMNQKCFDIHDASVYKLIQLEIQQISQIQSQQQLEEAFEQLKQNHVKVGLKYNGEIKLFKCKPGEQICSYKISEDQNRTNNNSLEDVDYNSVKPLPTGISSLKVINVANSDENAVNDQMNGNGQITGNKANIDQQNDPKTENIVNNSEKVTQNEPQKTDFESLLLEIVQNSKQFFNSEPKLHTFASEPDLSSESVQNSKLKLEKYINEIQWRIQDQNIYKILQRMKMCLQQAETEAQIIMFCKELMEINYNVGVLYSGVR
ncbi:Hypothetical_protein [Hexamita inflata]|uniref:Hypothetical_protein n=1 Tax=Hexamita inflata TaxID=28002 RepID=A0AA86PDK2_9EUKA|nr:Hypothetical protein HINF_LOCUS24651 [Hexamita inflata]